MSQTDFSHDLSPSQRDVDIYRHTSTGSFFMSRRFFHIFLMFQGFLRCLFTSVRMDGFSLLNFFKLLNIPFLISIFLRIYFPYWNGVSERWAQVRDIFKAM